jgi:hypothetical protein
VLDIVMIAKAYIRQCILLHLLRSGPHYIISCSAGRFQTLYQVFTINFLNTRPCYTNTSSVPHRGSWSFLYDTVRTRSIRCHWIIARLARATNAMFSPTFTFDAPRSPSLDSTNTTSTRDTSRSVSPCSPTSAFPPPRYSVTDLAAQMDKQRLRSEAQICHQPCSAYANTDDDAVWALPPLSGDEAMPTAVLRRVRTAPVTGRSTSPTSRRLQRQTNSRLLCSATHHKDIASLLERMVNTSEQCSVAPPTSLAVPTHPTEDDEGYDSAEDEREPSSVAARKVSVVVLRRGAEFRRASDFRKTGASISKDVRFRNREKSHLRQRSGDKT